NNFSTTSLLRDIAPRIEEVLMKSDGLADLLARFMERFVEKLLLENYRALKASAYNPMRFQRSIVTNAERFINRESSISRDAVAIADQRLAVDVARAQAQLLQTSPGFGACSPG